MPNDEYTNVAFENLDGNEQDRIENVIVDYIEENQYEECQQ